MHTLIAPNPKRIESRKHEMAKTRKGLWESSVVWALALLFAPAMALAGPAKVFLKPEIQVQPAEPVKVKDIATVLPAGSSLGEVVLGYGPTPGSSRTLDASYVKIKLNAANTGTEYLLQGPSQITLTGKCVRISSESLTEEAVTFVNEQLPQDGRVYQVTVDRPPKEFVLPDKSGVEVKPRLMMGSVKPGPNTVAIEARLNGRLLASTSVATRVTVTAEVLVATATIRQGEPINSSNTTWEQRDVTRTPNAVTLSGEDQLKEVVASRLISPGKTLTPTDMALPPAIRRGDVVTVTVKCGKVTLRTTAEARQDARIGETVSVRSTISQEDVRARVTGPGNVEITR